MKTYPQQFDPWRPDYPPVWNLRGRCRAFDHPVKPESKAAVNNNLIAFIQARNAIDRAMKL